MDSFKRLLDGLPIASHPLLSKMLVMGLIIVTGLVLVRLVRPRRSNPVQAGGVWADKMREKVVVQARPLMTGSEVALFNLLLLAVRNHFLLLAKVPLRSLVQLRIDDESDKRVLARTIRNVMVDFVVVHPGTQLPVKTIFLRKSGNDEVPTSRSQARVVDTLLHTAGLEVFRLDQDARYSVEQLTELLGLKEEV